MLLDSYADFLNNLKYVATLYNHINIYFPVQIRKNAVLWKMQSEILFRIKYLPTDIFQLFQLFQLSFSIFYVTKKNRIEIENLACQVFCQCCFLRVFSVLEMNGAALLNKSDKSFWRQKCCNKIERY